jgi:hypothetical protein
VHSVKKASRAAPKRPRKAPLRKEPRREKSPPAREAMLDLICGYWVSQLVFVAARLKLADVLVEKPLTAAVIAGRVGANAAFLYRVLRALASVGVFAELPDGRFRLTPLAQTLRSDGAGSLRDFALHNIDDYMWQTWGALEHGVMTGANAFEHVFRKLPFQYFHERPEKEREFAAAMASISAGQNAAVAEAYPFGKLTRLVDVGGAHGHLLAEILRRHKKLTGVLYDQPQVVARAPDSGFVTAPDVRGRCTIEGGNFFRSLPEGADGYVMKFIIHDWDDANSIRILENCRNAMAKGGRVIVVDNVIPKGNAKNWAKLLDINMMVAPGGKERTREEFADLMVRAGLRLTRVYPTKAGIGIVEAVAA